MSVALPTVLTITDVDPDVSHGAVDPWAVRAGSRDVFEVQYMPTSADCRFGIFQLYVESVPITDGTTTAWYPHYNNLHRLCDLVQTVHQRARERLDLGDTFDHLDLFCELTAAEVVFYLTTRPEWGAPPPWAPPVGTRLRLGVARSYFIEVWNEAQGQFRNLRRKL